MDPAKRYLAALEEEIRHVTRCPDSGPRLLYSMLHYHLGWLDVNFQPTQANAGKRLRPIFLLLACEAQGGDWYQALPAATAVELLHNFSLIHDDIEDRDEMRRGRRTLWALWGEAQAINAGDALFTLAYRALLNLKTTGVPAACIVEALARFNQTTLNLTEGQCRDISFETEVHVDEVTYLKMVAGKTAALLALCCELGGLIADAKPAHITALHDFGHALGMAFQMQDDLLGLWGDPARTGKLAASDLHNRKKTLPILHGLSHSTELQALLAQPKLDAAAVENALANLERAGSRAYTQERARVYHENALAALERTQGQGEAQAALHALAQRLLNRDK